MKLQTVIAWPSMANWEMYGDEKNFLLGLVDFQPLADDEVVVATAVRGILQARIRAQSKIKQKQKDLDIITFETIEGLDNGDKLGEDREPLA